MLDFVKHKDSVMSDVQIEVKGLDKLIAALDRFPLQIARNMSQAGHEAGTEILDTQGLRRYPSMTAANKPPTPYYIRGRGTQTKRGNLGNSERLGTQFYIKREGWTTHIGNRASYAKWVVGEEQARHMGPQGRIPKGWRKLFDVAKEKRQQIERIYNAWVTRTLRNLGL